MQQRWNWLRDRLAELGSNPSRFAKDLNWPPSRIYELFSGKTKAIPLDRVAKAAAILRVRLDSMLDFNSGLSDDIQFLSKNESDYAYREPENSIPEIDVYGGCGNASGANLINTTDEFGNTISQDNIKDTWDISTGFLNDISYNYNADNLSTRRIKDNWKIPAEYLNEMNVQTKNVYIIEALGDSMYPTIATGDKVIVDTSAKGRIPSPAGIFAIWDGLGVTIKRIELIPNTDPQTLKIISDNPKHSTYERSIDECRIIGRVAGLIKRI